MTKNKKVEIRVDEETFNKAKIRAALYFNGNLSEYVRYLIHNPNLRSIKKWKKMRDRSPSENNE